MGKLTTHVLDTANGRPGSGITVTVFYIDGVRRQVAAAVTNDDGRCDSSLLEGTAFQQGRYEIIFAAGAYFRAQGLALKEPLFVDDVVLRFGISNPDNHYHVPLLVSPWSYSTYRGS